MVQVMSVSLLPLPLPFLSSIVLSFLLSFAFPPPLPPFFEFVEIFHDKNVSGAPNTSKSWQDAYGTEVSSVF